MLSRVHSTTVQPDPSRIDFNTLSTELTGGKHPELTVNVVGTAVLSQPAGITWTLDNALLSGVATTHSLKTALNGGTAQSLPISFTTSGPRTYYLEITGTRPTEFFVAGNYKVSTTFTCT